MFVSHKSVFYFLLAIALNGAAQAMHTTRSSKEELKDSNTYTFCRLVNQAQNMILPPRENIVNNLKAYQYGLTIETVINKLTVGYKELETYSNINYLNDTKNICQEKKWCFTPNEQLVFNHIINKLSILSKLYMACTSSLSVRDIKFILLTHAQQEYENILEQSVLLEKSKNITPYNMRVLIRLFDGITSRTNCSEATTQKRYAAQVNGTIKTLAQLQKIVDPGGKDYITNYNFGYASGMLRKAHSALLNSSSDDLVNPYKKAATQLENADDRCDVIKEIIKKNVDENSSVHRSRQIVYEKFYEKLVQLRSDICKEYGKDDPLKELAKKVYSLQILVHATLTRLFAPVALELLERTKNEIANMDAQDEKTVSRFIKKSQGINTYLKLPSQSVKKNTRDWRWRWKGESLHTLLDVEKNIQDLLYEKILQIKSEVNIIYKKHPKKSDLSDDINQELIDKKT